MDYINKVMAGPERVPSNKGGGVAPDSGTFDEVNRLLDESMKLWELFVSRHELEDPEKKQAIVDEVIKRSEDGLRA